MTANNVLIVDNNPVFLHLLSKFLDQKGYLVSTADSGIAALDLVKSMTPGIVFMDLVMPGIDGEKLCRKFRETQNVKGATIVLLSALAVEHDMKYSEWGFDAFIAKGPFDQMATHIDSFLEELNPETKGRPKGEKIGFEDIQPREITRELLFVKAHLEKILSSVSEGVVEITDGSRILYANPAAIQIIGKPELMLLASDFVSFFRQQDQKEVAAILAQGDSLERKTSDYALWNGKTVSLNAVAVAEHGGKCVIVLSDITQRKVAEAALRYHSDLEKLITDISTRFINLSQEDVDRGISEALQKIGSFIGADRSYVFLVSDAGQKMANTHEWNAGGSERKSLMTGIDFQAAFPWFAKAIREKEILQIRGLDGLPAEAVAEMAEFKRQGIRSSINIPMISGGAFMGFVGFDSVREKSQWNEESISLLKIVGEIFANALNRSCAEKALRESERKFRELADLLPQVVFEFDKKGNFTFVNRFAKEFFGPTEEQGIMNSLQHITAGDKPKAIDHFRKILKGEKISAPEFGYTNIDGTVSSLAVHASRIVRDGKIVGCRGVAIDVTERKRWEDLYRSLVEKSFAGIYVLQGGKFKYLNSVFSRFTGYSTDEVLGHKATSIIHPEDRDNARNCAKEMLKGKRTSPYEFRIVRKDGSIRWAVEMVSPIFYEGQRAVLGNIMDLTERKLWEEQLKYLGTHDSLTGLYNRVYFEEELRRLEQGRRFPVNILMIDVDCLKEINDTLGHWAGDELLRRAAGILKQAFRKEDVVARIGGDEFAVIWTESDEAAANSVLPRIDHLLEEHNVLHPEYPVQLSVGLATGSKGSSLGELIKEADRKMYEQKALKKTSVPRTAQHKAEQSVRFGSPIEIGDREIKKLGEI